ncbi:MAG: DNA/RNA helicase domain-containing protein, partial [Myxococcota bacterium]|nr:DNA/RNA helicase domain-containing protein [Myxococcota bacterium]
MKGGDVYYHNHAWFRRKASGDYQIKDPFDQARKSEHVLEKFITAQRPKLKNKFGYCHAVALPHARLDGALPANAKRALILSVDELDGVHEWVVGAFEAWRAPKLMEQRDFQLMCDVLMPEFRIYRPVGASLTQINEQLILLTEQQRDKLHGLRRSNRVIIDGVAGSGKTMLAVQRARDFALNGQRTLLTCYNAALADWLKEQVERDELLDGAAGELIVQNFHRFASTCIKRAGVQMEWREGDDDFWREAIGLHLEQAWDILRARGEAPFDAIVVDEGQDFEEGWWWTICALLKDEDASPLYIFQDPDQTIREIEDSLPLEIPTRYELSTNCRNTKEIAGLSARFAAREVRSLDRSPSGPWPSVIFAQGENQQRGQVFTAVREFIS